VRLHAHPDCRRRAGRGARGPRRGAVDRRTLQAAAFDGAQELDARDWAAPVNADSQTDTQDV
jgi:hypothetical protein